jgi:hypothetical protein
VVALGADGPVARVSAYICQRGDLRHREIGLLCLGPSARARSFAGAWNSRRQALDAMHSLVAPSTDAGMSRLFLGHVDYRSAIGRNCPLATVSDRATLARHTSTLVTRCGLGPELAVRRPPAHTTGPLGSREPLNRPGLRHNRMAVTIAWIPGRWDTTPKSAVLSKRNPRTLEASFSTPSGLLATS